jgi:hypothetical protein
VLPVLEGFNILVSICCSTNPACPRLLLYVLYVPSGGAIFTLPAAVEYYGNAKAMPNLALIPTLAPHGLQ